MTDLPYFQSVKNLEQYHERERQFREDKFMELSKEEKEAIRKEANRVIGTIKAYHPRLQISVDGLLEAVIAALYFKKFGESPTATAIKANIKP